MMSKTVAFKCPDTFFETYERRDGDPLTTHYCPGCGHGMVHKYIAEAIDDFEMQDKAILVNPVGCSVFAYYYFNIGNVQVPHGRCPAVATAIKRARPDALVIGYQGDGDLAAIGGNEILQAANRGENVTIFFINNAIYGMTGGQMAPTTLIDMKTSTSPMGRQASNEGFPIQVCELLDSLQAPYYLERVAVGDSKHNRKTRKAIRKALQYQNENKGFSLVEILSPCATGWKQTPVDAARWTIEKLTEVFPLGVLRDGHELDLGHPRYRKDVSDEDLMGVLGLHRTADPDLGLPDAGWELPETRFKISGFGGQGVLLMGILLAQAGMVARRQVCWMPSYGPEMRGGTAYCNVTLSDEEIASPLIQHPSVLVAMNAPSLNKFGGDVVPGGTIYYNASLINEAPQRTDVTAVPVRVNEIAERVGNPKVGNMVMLGAILARTPSVSKEAVAAALPDVLKKSDPAMRNVNMQAIDAGMEEASEARTTV